MGNRKIYYTYFNGILRFTVSLHENTVKKNHENTIKFLLTVSAKYLAIYCKDFTVYSNQSGLLGPNYSGMTVCTHYDLHCTSVFMP